MTCQTWRRAPVKYAELEDSLGRLPAVDKVRVVGENGHIAEVHVLAVPGKPAKQIVRDVQSLAMAAFGLAVDRRVISVVQIQDDQISQVHRPSILDIAETTKGNHVELCVSLGWHGEVFRGASTGPLSLETRPRLVGEATLKALEQALNGDVALALSNIETIAIGPRTISIAGGGDGDERRGTHADRFGDGWNRSGCRRGSSGSRRCESSHPPPLAVT